LGDEISKDKKVGESAPSKGNTPSKSSKPAGKAASASVGLPQQVDLMWAIALVVVAFVIGFMVRGLFPATPATSPSVSDSISAPAGTGAAPTLTPEQLNEGELPAGHPSIGDGSQPSTATAPSGSMGDVKSDVPPSGDIPAGGQSVEPTEDKN